MNKQYVMTNTPKIHQPKANIANWKQGDLDVGDFYSKLTNLWNELSNVIKVTMCTCTGCKCRAASKITPIYEDDKAHEFLIGLKGDQTPQLEAKFWFSIACLLLIKFSILQQKENHEGVYDCPRQPRWGQDGICNKGTWKHGWKRSL